MFPHLFFISQPFGVKIWNCEALWSQSGCEMISFRNEVSAVGDWICCRPFSHLRDGKIKIRLRAFSIALEIYVSHEWPEGLIIEYSLDNTVSRKM